MNKVDIIKRAIRDFWHDRNCDPSVGWCDCNDPRDKDLVAKLSNKIVEELEKAEPFDDELDEKDKLIKDYQNKYHDQNRIIQKHYARIQGQNEEIAELKSSKEQQTSLLHKKEAIIFVLRNRINKQVCDDINKKNRETFYINIKHMNRRKRYKTLEDASKMTQRNQVVLRVTDCFKVKKEAERVNYD